MTSSDEAVVDWLAVRGVVSTLSPFLIGWLSERRLALIGWFVKAYLQNSSAVDWLAGF